MADRLAVDVGDDVEESYGVVSHRLTCLVAMEEESR